MVHAAFHNFAKSHPEMVISNLNECAIPENIHIEVDHLTGGRGMYEAQQEFSEGYAGVQTKNHSTRIGGFGYFLKQQNEIPGDKLLNTFDSIKPSFSSGQSWRTRHNMYKSALGRLG